MMRRKDRFSIFVALAAAVTASGGCSLGDGGAPLLGLPSPGETGAGTNGVPSASETLQGILTPQDVVVGTPTEVYTLIARGVLTCWFGADGPLKAKYIYHAEAEPASKGGRSEIKIMTRDQDADDPRALRAYRIVISPSHDQAKVELENVRLPEAMAARLKLDVERWSRDQEGCGEGPVTAGWAAEPADATKPADTKEKTGKKP